MGSKLVLPTIVVVGLAAAAASAWYVSGSHGHRHEGNSGALSDHGGDQSLTARDAPETLEEGPQGASRRDGKKRIFVVSSYHREYLWTQDTQRGLCAALLKYGLLDGEDQAEEFTRNDRVESRGAVLRKVWMDTKRRNSRSDIARATAGIVAQIRDFAPDVVLLGDDNAANYVGNVLLDTDVPVVFWGVNGLPMKYGLLDSMEKPGHNATGVYQQGYLRECIDLLLKVSPGVKRMAVISDDSPTGRSKTKQLKRLANEKQLPVELVEYVSTNNLGEWKAAVLRLAKEVDAFFVLNHNSIKDEEGNPVDQLEIGAWYLRNVKLPECAHERQFAVEGMLCVCDDSGYNQGFGAARIACEILSGKARAADIPVTAPPKGPNVVNRARAKMLGVSVGKGVQVDEWVEEALALEKTAGRGGPGR